MTAYIIRRLMQGVIVLIIVSILIFLGMRFLPGDPVLLFISEWDYAKFTEEELNVLRAQFGLDRSLPEQYAAWVGGLFRGDLGESILYRGVKVSELLAESMPITLQIGILAAIVSTILGILAGLTCALRRGGPLDAAVTSGANIGISVPEFWLGVLLIYALGLKLGWLPIQGYTSPFEDFWLNTRQLVMPVTCLAVVNLAGTARLTRSSMLEIIRQDYIRTAWSKGLRERTIVIRHVVKNGLIPVITMLGMYVRLIIGGSVIIETVFNIPGMGRVMVTAVFGQDYQIVQGGCLVIAAVIVLTNLIVDISYGWLDPRIRYG